MSTSPTRSRRWPFALRADVLALALTGLVAAGLSFLAGRPGRPAGNAALRRPVPAEAASSTMPGARQELCTEPIPFDAPDPSAARAEPASVADFGARFVALAARDPLALEALAETLLASDAPENEQLAFLATLRASGSPAAVRWHEEAVRTGRASSDAAGVGLAEVALATLRADAAFDSAARDALARLAFECPTLAPGLRRRAATAFAAHADDAGLARLELALAREPDPVLVEGCLVALSERAPGFARTRLLAAHGRGDAHTAALTEE